MNAAEDAQAAAADIVGAAPPDDRVGSAGSAARSARPTGPPHWTTARQSLPAWVRHAERDVCTVICGGCGGDLVLSRRRMRGHVVQGTQPRCPDCRSSGRRLPEREQFEAQAWALQQLLDTPAPELREIAYGLEQANWL